MAAELKKSSELVSLQGDKIVLEEFSNDTMIITHWSSDGEILFRTCKGGCGGKPVGPIDCPPGKFADIDCTARPPTIKCY